MSGCCGTSNGNTGHRSKVTRTDEPGNARPSSPRLLMIVLLAVVAIGAIFYFVNPGSTFSNGSVSAAEAAVTPATNGSEVTYPESAFADGKAKFFDYKTSDGRKVRYFVIKSSDGVIRAAFDACDVCWESGKGYKQDGDFMVCQNCGRRFQSTKVNVVTGGCNPSALTRTIRDGRVVITAQALDEGRRLFK
jgi:uncharacterized membrane protein